jgi:D-alanyl-D-alanine dipeptidase
VLKRYSILALIVLSVEITLLFLFRIPIKEVVRVPQTFEEEAFREKAFSASLLPKLFSSSDKKNDSPTSATSQALTILEQKFIRAGMVSIRQIDSSIALDLKYATKDNFLHKNLYGNLKNGYLQKEIAVKLAAAQKKLKEKYPFYSLVLFDAARPLSIQQTMWNELQVPEKNKIKYVSNPEVGSLHNFGCAVDVSIINEEGWEMDMGTPYDYFGELGHPAAEPRMIQEGKLSWRQFENRKLLREVMTEAGFTIITTEWWHFNGTSLNSAEKKYKMVE